MKMNMNNIKNNLKNKMHTHSPMHNMLIALGTLFIIIITYHFISSAIQKFQLERDAEQPVTVSSIKVGYQEWQPRIQAVGNLFAKKGIDVTAEIDGIISQIHIISNQEVKKGDLIVQLKAEPDLAALASLKAEADLARATYERSKKDFTFNAVSAQTVEENEYDLHIAEAAVDEQQALVNLKNIRAAFDGIIGISKLSPGQFIGAGEPIISLQALDTLYINFYLPEQNLAKLKIGQDIVLRTDAYPNKTFSGKLMAIDPVINVDTHNIELQAAIENSSKELLPGMYAQIEVSIGKPTQHLTIPQSAISYNPYGNFVYIISKEKKKLFVKQHFITLGEVRGDQVAVIKGLQEGDEIVSSGQIKLKNESKIVINNEIQPSFDAAPKVTDE